MFQFAVCDDEMEDRNLLCKYVEEYCRKKKISYGIRRFESGEQFLKSSFKPDILFLDIMMYEKDGIQVGREIKKQIPDLLIIYTTNLCEKISVAINRIHAFGYLEKPIEEESLYDMIKDAIRYLERKEEDIKVAFLSVHKTMIELSVSNIYYFEYTNRLVKIETKEKQYICREKINDIADKMKEYGFVMSHQSFVVNLYQVEKISDQSLIMKNGDKVWLAQKRASTVRKQLMQLAQRSREGGK